MIRMPHYDTNLVSAQPSIDYLLLSNKPEVWVQAILGLADEPALRARMRVAVQGKFILQR